MKILILSANTGGGHNATANAIGAELRQRGEEYAIADAIAFISPRISELVSLGHSYVYRKLPRLFGIGYRYEERHPTRFLYARCAKGADALWERLRAEAFDAVICVHVFAAMMMTEVRRRTKCPTPAYFVATDYTCSPGVSETRMDGYFIPHPMLRGEFIRSGISADRLFATGIPVGEAFCDTDDKDRMRRALRLPTDGKVLLLSCGSMGCGRLEKNARKLASQLDKDTTLIVLCGKNEELYAALLPHAGERLRVLRFTEHVATYMAAADMYLTKPGGLSTSEAIAKRLPMLLVDAVPGLETRNFDFLIGRGVACGARKWGEVATLVNRLLREDGVRQAQIEAMERFGGRSAAQDVCAHVLEE